MNLKNMMGMSGMTGGLLAKDPLAFSPVMMVKRAFDDDKPKRRYDAPKAPTGPKVPDILSGGLAGMMLKKKHYT